MHAGSDAINPAIYTDWITLDAGMSESHYAEITAGFQAHNMDGGMIAWEQAGYEIER